MKTLLLLLALAAGCRGDGGIAYRGPPPEQELFHFNDKVFYFYSAKAGWDEANAVCQSMKGGSLATPDNSIKAAYLAQSIGEAWAALEDMWIGGQLVKNVWQWVDGSKIPETSRQAANMSFVYPPWVDGGLPNRKGRNCLAIDRNGHSDPYFIDLECKMKRPYICQTGFDKANRDPIAKQKVTIFDYEYVIYHGRLTWEGAVAFCRSQGYVLATIYNSSYAEKLARAMLKSRPEFEDVWIGGSYKNDKWAWIENSEEIPQDPVPSGVAGTMFPPWAHVPPNPGENCVLFDRHLCETPKFIDIKCKRLRDFACAKLAQKDEEPEAMQETTTVRKKKYIIHHTLATFDEARTLCESDKNADGEGKLLYIDGGETRDPYDELSIIMQLMSDSADELIHVWLAAQYDDSAKQFKWLYDVPNYIEGSPYNSQILAAEADDATGYPPWCNNDEPTAEMACLNLDRQNYNTPLYYGLECNVTQAVICVVESIPNGVERFHVRSRGYQSSEYLKTGMNATWKLARKLCEEETGALLTDVDSEELAEIAKKLPDGDYFIGGRYSGTPRVPTWHPSMSPIKLDGVNFPPPARTDICLALVVSNGAATEIKAVNCDDKLHSNFICVDRCGPEINEVEDHTWHCNWLSGTAVTEAVVGKSCDKRCPVNRVLVGSRKIQCSTRGWTGYRYGAPATCEEPASAANVLTSMLTSNASDGSSLLIIYDGSSGVGAEQLQVIKYIVGSTISTQSAPAPSAGGGAGGNQENDASQSEQAQRKRRNIGHRYRNRRSRSRRAKSRSKSRSRSRRQSDTLDVLLVSLNTNSSAEPTVLEAESECQVVSKLNEEHFVRGHGVRDYSRAFQSARKYLENTQTQYTVVVISAGPNQGEDYRDELRKLKKAVKSVITIGVGNRHNYDELADMASVDSEQRLQHAAVAEYGVFKELGDSIAAASGKCSAELGTLKSEAEAAAAKIEENNRNGGNVELELPPGSNDGGSEDGAEGPSGGNPDYDNNAEDNHQPEGQRPESDNGNEDPLRKQGVNENAAPEQGGNENTAPEEGHNESPAQEQGGNESPAQEQGGNESPAQEQGGDGSPAPAEGGDGSPAPAEGGEASPAPAEGGDGSPAPTEGGDGSPAPAEGGDGSPAPAEGGDESPAPAEGGEAPAPAEGGEAPTPAEGGEAPAPAEGGEAPAPAEGGEAPAAEGGEAPAAEGGEAPAPAEGGEAPAAEGGEAPAAEGGEAPAPAEGGEAPAAEGGEAPAAEGGEAPAPSE